MTTVVSKVLWSSRYQVEHDRLMTECARVVSLGGTFSIENKYMDNWYSVFTFNYPDAAAMADKGE